MESTTEAEKLLRTRYHVSPERSRLCVEASEATVQAAQLLRPQDVSVYVGIPFCPTRCAYCSFVSSSIERFSGLLEPYLDALIREIAHTGDAWLTLIIYSFQGLWQTGSSTFIYSEELKTVNYAIGQILSAGAVRNGASAASSFIMMVVPIVVFLLSQSQIIETMGSSGMKD